MEGLRVCIDREAGIEAVGESRELRHVLFWLAMTEERFDHLEKIVLVNAQAIAYLERTVASLQEQFAEAKQSMDRLHDALTGKEYHGDWEVRARYHEREAAWYREMSEMRETMRAKDKKKRTQRPKVSVDKKKRTQRPKISERTS